MRCEPPRPEGIFAQLHNLRPVTLHGEVRMHAGLNQIRSSISLSQTEPSRSREASLPCINRRSQEADAEERRRGTERTAEERRGWTNKPERQALGPVSSAIPFTVINS
jgi:hypothetical protein